MPGRFTIAPANLRVRARRRFTIAHQLAGTHNQKMQALSTNFL